MTLLVATVTNSPAAASHRPASACPGSGETSGEISPDGAVDIVASREEACTSKGGGSGGGPSYPQTFWETRDVYWADQGSCPDGQVRGVRRYYSIAAPGEEPTFLYDATGCVPVPTSADEVDLDAVDIEAILRGYLPQPTVARDPYVDGLVGLETYFWYDGDPLTDVDHDGDPTTPDRPGWQATITHQGITITATLHVTRFTWQVAPGEHVTATVPGSPDQPAASHTYRTTGTYDLIASTTWTGHYTWTVAGTTDSGTLDTVTLDSPPEPFRVREVRAVPAQPDG